MYLFIKRRARSQCLSVDATEHRIFVPPAQGELTEEGRVVSISKCALR